MTSESDEPSRNRWLLPVAGAFVALLVLVWWPGCRTYPPVSSREAMSILRLLNTACNTRDTQRLAEAERRLAALNEQGKLNERERDAFQRIIRMARAGQWVDAEEEAFKMAQDQVGVGHPDPEPNEAPASPGPAKAKKK